MNEPLGPWKNGDRVEFSAYVSGRFVARHGWVVAIVKAREHVIDIVKRMRLEDGSDWAMPAGAHMMKPRDHDSLLIEVPMIGPHTQKRHLCWPKLDMLTPYAGEMEPHRRGQSDGYGV